MFTGELRMLNEYLVMVRIFIALLFLIWFSILDYRTRDIPDKYIWIWGGISIFSFIASLILYRNVLSWFIIYTLLSLMIGPGLFGLLSYFELMGWADFFTVLWITLMFPIPDIYLVNLVHVPLFFHFPPIIPIILYSSLSIALIALFRGLYSLVRYRKMMPLNASTRDKIALLFTGRAVSVKNYLNMKHYYPLTIPKVEDGKVVFKIRRSFDIYEEYEDYQRELKKLLDNGLIEPEDKIWVTYGIPFIIPLLLGFIFTVLVGDAPLLYLLMIIR